MQKTHHKQRRFLLLCLLAALLPFAALSAQDKKPLNQKVLDKKALDPQQVRATLAKYGNEISELPGLLPAGWKIIRIEEGVCDTTATDMWEIFNNPLVEISLMSDTSDRELALLFYPISVYTSIKPVIVQFNIQRDFSLYPEYFLTGNRYCLFIRGNTYIWNNQRSDALNSGSFTLPYSPDYNPIIKVLSRLFVRQ